MAIAAQRSATFHVREFRRLRIHTLADADSGRACSRCRHIGTNGLEFGRFLILNMVLSGTGDRQRNDSRHRRCRLFLFTDSGTLTSAGHSSRAIPIRLTPDLTTHETDATTCRR